MPPVSEPLQPNEEDLSIYTLTPEKVQAKIEQAIDAGKALDLSGFLPGEAHGDRYISAWALDQLLKIKYPGKKISLAYTGDALHTPRPFTNIGNMLEVLAHHTRPEKPQNFRELKLRQFATILGIPDQQLRQSGLLEQIPGPTELKSDRIFGSFNLEKQRQAAGELRAHSEWKGRPIIAVFQSGSIPEKRLSDQQVQQVVDVVRRQTPDAVIIVVTDKQLLNINKFPREERLNRGDYADTVELVVEANSLDEVGAVALAAEKIITTDTLWGWWAAGCKVQDGEHMDGKLKPGELLELMTVAGKFWQIPGAEGVRSEAVESPRTRKSSSEMIVSSDYQKHYGGAPGIHQRDMDRLLKALQPKKRGWFSLLKK